ncbi:ROK family transcriptional regulator [Actinotalea sp. M2MS4P-6]|uniref:ROK family transcriptional regulator n=1 Tax=Actinotalea sp. M2MS4P-6 TaxID=2983762 RepID=UPI0021E3A93B|nr:ROK family transcriptional regulator [Actinotalea sp. M2MS4P-6]MCV2393251.1 ROK family transcriptional regulator [Actinotalea sp. M2MS4P-6]
MVDGDKSTPAPAWLLDGPGAILQLIRREPEGLTKLDIAHRTGISRTAVSQRVDTLLGLGLLEVRSTAVFGRGRPAERFGLARGRRVILVADTGATGMRVAACDATGEVLGEELLDIDITTGPIEVLTVMDHGFQRQMRAHGRTPADVIGIGIDVPGPVAHDTGRVVSPPIMTGWHEYDIPAAFRKRYGCSVIVEKDTNAMVLGEHVRALPDVENMVFVKIGTGIGTGLLIRGELYRGTDGAAGDIGHVSLTGRDDDGPLCRCGNRGCVEAYAGGWALARDLTEAGYAASSVSDVVNAVRGGNRTALSLVRHAGTILGTAISDIVNMLNPAVVVVGGQLAALDDILLATAREAIYHRSLPLATRNLRIVPSALPDPGVHGLARLVADTVFHPAAVDRMLLAPKDGD